MSRSMLKVSPVGLLPLKQQISLITMSPRQRRRLINFVCRRVIRDSKQRVKQQVDLQGRAFEPRKRKRARKMLSRLVRFLRVTSLSGQRGVISFFNKRTGKIAADHQYGATTTVTANSLKDGGTGHEKPATRKQAKELLSLGFKVRRPTGKGWQKPSQKHIIENYSRGQAGIIIRSMRDDAGEKTKSSWKTVLPARAFLGATKQEVTDYISTILEEKKQELRYGYR